MHNNIKGVEKRFGFIITLLALIMIPSIMFGGEIDKKTERYSDSQSDYILIVKENLISLKAKDASVKEILEDIGRRMKIEVVANIPREEIITIELDMVYLGDAIKRFRTNYAYITESEEKEGKITKIVVVPKGLGKAPSIPSKKIKVKPKQFKLKYNPQPSVQKEK